MRAMVICGLTYGLLVFLAGSVLGALREIALIPMLGTRLGGGLEFALMLLVAVAIAGWLLLRQCAPMALAARLCFGLIGTAMLLALESSLALMVLGLPLESYLAGYDITAGAVFPFGLAVMLLAPALFKRR